MTQVPITWWGHATTTIELAGLRVLTDPVLTARLGHLRRLGGPAPAPDALRADVVLISHLHADHLHLRSLRRLDARTTVVAPRGTAGVLRRDAELGREGGLSARLVEIDPWGTYDAGPCDAGRYGAGDHADHAVRIQAVPARHPAQRLPYSRHRAPALGYLLRAGGASVWFAGDTGLSPQMRDIGPVDIALVPVGGWGPTLGPEHLDPRAAAEAVRRVGAQHAVPIHFGTFWPVGLRRVQPATFRRLFEQPGVLFGEALAHTAPMTRAHLLPVGRRTVIDSAP